MTRSYVAGAVMVSKGEPTAARVDLNQGSCAKIIFMWMTNMCILDLDEIT